MAIATLGIAGSASAELVLDIAPGEDHRVTGPIGLAQVGDRAFFALGTPEFGAELWVSDGTQGGTRRVLDIYPGSASGVRTIYVQNILPFRGQALFQGLAPGSGSGLWLSDGTPEGTWRIESPPLSWYVSYATAGDHRIFFRTPDEDGIERLWASDGIPGHPATPVAPGLTPKKYLTLPDGRVLFWVTDAAAGDELWVSDGTPGGTQRVVDPAPGPDGTALPGFAPFLAGALFFFETGDEPDTLWYTDGTEAGTRAVFSAEPAVKPLQGGAILAVGSYAFFDLFDPSLSRYRTWRTDGTPEGTIPFAPTAGRPALGFVTASGHVVYDESRSSARAVYVTDGTLPGTRKILSGTSDLRDAVSLGDRLVFKTGPQDGFVWGSDGQLRQTSDHGLYAFDDRAFFPSDGQPWTTDGTEAGTRQFIEIAGNRISSGPRLFTSLGDVALFRVGPPVSGNLWRSDGTAEGTFLVHDYPTQFHLGRVGGSLLYAGFGELWTAGGDAGSARFLAPLSIDFLDDRKTPLWASLGDRIVFRASAAGTDYEPWVSDGTPEGTRLLRDILPGTAGSYPSRFLRVGDRILFFDVHGGWRLWESDGTPEGTQVLATVPADVFVSRYYAAPEVAAAGDELFLTACTFAVGVELFRFDFASGDLVLVKDLDASDNETSVCLLFAYIDGYVNRLQLLSRIGDRLFFSNHDDMGAEPWVSDGTEIGTFRLRDIRPGSESSLERNPPVEAVGQRVFFVADDGVHGEELWISDGTSEGTRLIDVWPGPAGSTPRSLNEVEGRLFFVATTAEGDGLFTSDGTAAGTQRLAGEAPTGPAWTPTGPASMAAAGDRLLYPATTDALGTELYAVDLPRLEIDIKPGSHRNPVNPFGRGVIPVAILGSDAFDVTGVDVTTLAFGPGGATPVHRPGGHLGDVNDDGFTDLLSHYRTPETGIAPGDTEACVTGETLWGTPIEGCDDIRTAAPCGNRFAAALVLPLLVSIGGRLRRRKT